MSAIYRVGDVFERMADLPDGSVDLVMTSPPFLALRSYLPDSHPDKAKEIGSEATPAEFIDTLLALTAEWRRLLAPHGSICVELGDTYAGSGGAGGDYADGGLREGQQRFDGTATKARRLPGDYPNRDDYPRPRRDRVRNTPSGWPMEKSLTGIPDAYELSLAYGYNVLDRRGPDSPAGRWRVRNKVAWVRPNPPVGALCVDDQTEALTPDGWKRHDHLVDGDLIAAYDPRTDSCRFMPAKFARYHRDSEPMVAIDKRSTSQRLTEDHRVWTRTRKSAPHVRLARDLTNDCDTLLCAPFDDVAGPAPVTTERAALLGWYIAEGSPHHRQARIVQSLTANPHKVDRIRHLLDVDGTDYTETTYQHSGGSTIVTFHVKGELAEWLNLHHKRLPMQYVTTWPEAQTQALFDALVDGDGHRRKNADGVLFHQQDERVMDAMQVLALRLGYRATKTFQPTMRLWQLTMSRDTPTRSVRWTRVRKWDGEGIRRETYTGTVWCPMVETSFWLARRDGKTFVTGNSDKFRPATSYLTIATIARDRYFDLDAVRGAPSPNTHARTAKGVQQLERSGKSADRGGNWSSLPELAETAGAPPLDWWEIPPGGYSGKTTSTRRERVPAERAAACGAERTTSPDCPVHAGLPGQLPRALRDARAAEQSPHTRRNGDGHAQEQLAGFAPIDGSPDRSDSSPDPTSERSDPGCSPAATIRSTAFHRTDPSPATTRAGTPSGERSPRTDGTSESPSSDERHPGTSESSTSAAGWAGSPTSRTTDGTAGNDNGQGSNGACTCSWYRTITESTSHYAVYPTELCEKPIEAMCPRRVCTTCGQPSRRITEQAPEYRAARAAINAGDPDSVSGSSDVNVGNKGAGFGHGGGVASTISNGKVSAAPVTVGWTDCDHDTWRPGLVLDPFAGSGTTLVVAHGRSRDSIGIDIDSRNALLARERLGMFLEVEDPAAEGVA